MEEDFDFEKGNFNCSSSGYTSHWWSAQELKDILEGSFPGKIEDLNIDFKVEGVGIFAICTIKSNWKIAPSMKIYLDGQQTI